MRLQSKLIKLRIFIKYPKGSQTEEITLDDIKKWKSPSKKNAQEVREILREGGNLNIVAMEAPYTADLSVIKDIAVKFLEKINIIVPHHHSHEEDGGFKSSGNTPPGTYVVGGETYDNLSDAREAGWEPSPRIPLKYKKKDLFDIKWNLYEECIGRPEEVDIKLLKEGVSAPEYGIYIPENKIVEDEFVGDESLPAPGKTQPGKPRDTPPSPEIVDELPAPVVQSEKKDPTSTNLATALWSCCKQPETESEDSEDPDPWRTLTRNKGKPAPEIARTKKRKRRLNRLKRDAICHNCSNNFYEKMARRHCKTRGKVWDKKNNLCRSRKKSKKKKKTKGKKKKTKNKYFK
jgi:hypothetical protein